jgi:FtsP/CotA-like multicopper oxidase with cupredoxin domain
MNRRRFVVTGLSAAAVGGALAAACSNRGGLGSLVPGSGGGPAAEVASSGVTVLTPQYATVDLAGYKLHVRTYNGKTVGPMVETRGGATLSYRIVNNLPPNPKATYPPTDVEIPIVENSMQAMDPRYRGRLVKSHETVDEMNDPHDFNTTNLHVHGIQTVPHLFDPVGTSNPMADMIAVEPGHSFDYHFPVPSDHPSGLHWYHPHHHGGTDVQVSGGMAGLIVVRGEIDEVPEIKAARELFFAVQSLEVNESKTFKGEYDREYIAYEPPNKGGYSLDADYAMMTSNGEPVAWYDINKGTAIAVGTPPQYAVAPGEVVRLRLLNGTDFAPLMLVLPGFQAWDIGFDGVNLLKATYKDISGKGTTLVTPVNLFTAPVRFAFSGNRIEMLLKAPAKPGTYTLSTLGTAGFSGNVPPYDIATFVVSGAPVNMGIPTTLPTPVREYPVITEADVKVKRTIVFNEGACKRLMTGFCFEVDGKLYDMTEVSFNCEVGTCEEWRLENATPDGHPFHIHTNSFQLIAINDQPVDPVQIWDTHIIPPQIGAKRGSITMRIRFVEWKGKDVFHCHILPHEDTGMMVNFTLV